MTEQEAIVNLLDEKIKKLILIHEELKMENTRLMSEKTELGHAISLKDNEIVELRNKYEQLRLAKLLVSGSEDVHSAKLKVNRIVREIDRCVALLNK
jgi:hypothetical protein